MNREIRTPQDKESKGSDKKQGKGEGNKDRKNRTRKWEHERWDNVHICSDKTRLPAYIPRFNQFNRKVYHGYMHRQ